MRNSLRLLAKVKPGKFLEANTPTGLTGLTTHPAPRPALILTYRETLVSVGHKELKKNGVFVLHGFAKFVFVKKPARPAREGINPFTKEKQMFAAKPASKAVRARPVKAVKDAVK